MKDNFEKSWMVFYCFSCGARIKEMFVEDRIDREMMLDKNGKVCPNPKCGRHCALRSDCVGLQGDIPMIEEKGQS